MSQDVTEWLQSVLGSASYKKRSITPCTRTLKIPSHLVVPKSCEERGLRYKGFGAVETWAKTKGCSTKDFLAISLGVTSASLSAHVRIQIQSFRDHSD